MRTLQVTLSAFAVVTFGTGAMASDRFVVGERIELAQTQTKQNRDERQEGRQGTRDERQNTRDDCRDVEGVAGKDKRDCKQEGRSGSGG